MEEGIKGNNVLDNKEYIFKDLFRAGIQKEEKREKNLFYKEESEFVYISGPGTFDNKATIKSIGGEWKPGKKSWCIPIKNFNENIDKFPNIEKIEN